MLSTFKATSENNDKRDGSAPLLEIPSLKAPLTRYSSGEGISLLQKLVSEQSSKFIAQSEEQVNRFVDFTSGSHFLIFMHTEAPQNKPELATSYIV